MASRADDKVHFDLAMSPLANAEIESIASSQRISPGEVVSRAVDFFIQLEKARKDGQTVGLLDADKKPVLEFVGL